MTTYTASQLSNLRSAGVNMMVFSAVNGQPVFQFQSSSQNNLPYYFATLNISGPMAGMPTYLCEDTPGVYRYVSYANVMCVVFYDVQPSFDTWLNTNGSALFNSTVSLSNGTFPFVYVTKKREYTYTPGAYNVLWDGQPNVWNVEPQVSSPTSLMAYLTSLTGYDIRMFYNSPSFYTPDIKQSITTYMSAGQITVVVPVLGNIYMSTDFTQIQPSLQNFITLTTFTDTSGNILPKIVFQGANDDGNIKLVTFSQGTIGYASLNNGHYTYFLEQDTTKSGFIIVDSSFAAWIQKNNSTLLSNFYLSVNGNNYNTLVVVVKPLFTPINTIIPIDASNTTMFSTPDTTNITNWLTQIVGYDIRLFTDGNAAWFNSTVIQAINDFTTTINAITPVPPLAPTISTNTANPNLIYTHSLYDNSSNYFNNIATLMQQEYNNELQLQQTLAIDVNDGVLTNELKAFMDNQTQNITNSLSNIQTLNTNLKNIVASNQATILENNQLNSLLTSQQAQTLSNNIIQLRNTIYDSIEYLTSNQRMKTGQDVIYLINRTSF